MARRCRMSLRKQFATVFSDWRDMPVRKHLASAGSPQARRCASLVRLTGRWTSGGRPFSADRSEAEKLDSALGAFP